jgi:hypothetical protein
VVSREEEFAEVYRRVDGIASKSFFRGKESCVAALGGLAEEERQLFNRLLSCGGMLSVERILHELTQETVMRKRGIPAVCCVLAPEVVAVAQRCADTAEAGVGGAKTPGLTFLGMTGLQRELCDGFGMSATSFSIRINVRN